MRCQLARYVHNERRPDVVGWYLWVEIGPPHPMAARDYDTNERLPVRMRYDTPYFSHVVGGQISIEHRHVEVYSLVTADIPTRPFEEWIAARGEPPPTGETP